MTPMISPTVYARTAGVLYLLIAVIAAVSIGYIPSVLVVAGDAAATSANLLANPILFGLGLTGDIFIMLIEIALSVMLFVLLRPVSPTLSLITMIARLAEVAVMATNVLLKVMTLVVLNSALDTNGIPSVATQDIAVLLIDAHGYGIFIWDIFFGFSLLTLGYLVVRSGFFPRLLGAGMLIGSFGYMLEGITRVTFVESATLAMLIVGLLVIATVGELAFAFWLLIRGINLPAFRARLAIAAAA